MTIKVLVLGAAGMLGSATFRCFRERASFDVTGTIRSASGLAAFPADARTHLIPNVDVLDQDTLVTLFGKVRPNLVINAVGVVKQLPAAKDPLHTLPLNAMLPHRLARLCELSHARLIHVSTDCVFSGKKGNYVESDFADADDLYGRSKLLGELTGYPCAVTLRTSIIGREVSAAHSLLDWFLSQEGVVRGYRKAIFSGLPTCELARIMRDVILPRPDLAGLYHVSAAPISKFELLHLIAREYSKTIEIQPDDEVAINRSLDSSRFSSEVGYVAPDWTELIRRMYKTELVGR